MAIKIGVIEGNGIGPEITKATMHVMEATGLSLQWIPIAIGDAGIAQYGHPLPQESVQTLKQVRRAIKAPLLVDKLKGRITCEHADGSIGIYPSLNNAIRRELGLFVDPRPIRGVKHLSGRYASLDVHIMREITEGVYRGIEHEIGDVAAECTKLITREASIRVAEYSFAYARKNGRKKVTCVHKANAISMTDGLFLKCFREAAKRNPDISSDDCMIDAAAYYLAKTPSRFDVICAMNQYGDILSDLAAGLVGSLGLAPGANIGADGLIVAEASHGAAPDIAGMGIANPIALILSGAFLLKHIGETEAAALIEDVTYAVLAEGHCLTPDLGGTATTMELAETIADGVRKRRAHRESSLE